MDEEYLSHHGIKDQRWGVRHGPPYPVRRGSGGKPKTTSVVKSKLKAVSRRLAEGREEKKTARAQAYEDAKARITQKRAESKAEAHGQLRERVVKHPQDLYKYKNEFSREEIDDIIKDIEFDRKLKDVRIQEIKRGMESYGRLKDFTGTTFQLMNSAKGIYNIAAEFNNAMVDSGKSNGNKWTKLGGGDSGGNNSGSGNKKQEYTLTQPKGSSGGGNMFGINIVTGGKNKDNEAKEEPKKEEPKKDQNTEGKKKKEDK